jgi:hypothetical protein
MAPPATKGDENGGIPALNRDYQGADVFNPGHCPNGSISPR